jgi:hypothetical protein
MLFDVLDAKPRLNNKQSTDKTIPKTPGHAGQKTILRGFVKCGGRSLP